jgi:hypothetical protein
MFALLRTFDSLQKARSPTNLLLHAAKSRQQ